ncbi:MAG: glycosyltransferase family 4 protein [Candidatus Binatia bacterium]
MVPTASSLRTGGDGTAASQFHVLAFEGPDGYAQAGGIASRVTGLTQALADAGFDTHLWFIGDPQLPGHEVRRGLSLHRWCQWISAYHPGGVYDGEEGKRLDYARSLPPALAQDMLLPYLADPDHHAVVLAEEWQTVDAVLHLDWLLRQAGLRHRVTILWNANNTFSFDRIGWERLARAAVITTVSRYMRQLMRPLGVDALVIPNGLSADALRPPDRAAVAEFRRRLRGRVVLAKVARWDPDKRWMLAVQIVAELKRQGWCPLLVARGGCEAHGAEVLATAAAAGLKVVERNGSGGAVEGLLHNVEKVDGADIVSLRVPLAPATRGVLFRGAAAVLANSKHEPFGLVGLETMAAGGVACTGCSGEDYVIPGQNALVLGTADPREFVSLFRDLRKNPARAGALRQAGKITARRYAWPAIVENSLLPRFRLLAGTRDGVAGRTAVH